CPRRGRSRSLRRQPATGPVEHRSDDVMTMSAQYAPARSWSTTSPTGAGSASWLSHALDPSPAAGR
ncbi:MAG: hypothetical protein AVDCRST_MAG07-3140, partial [uncultured Frankineae bacterium]